MKIKIRELCKLNNTTLRKLSKDLNIPYQTLSNYSTGFREPDLKTLTDIAKWFNVSVDALFYTESNSINISHEDFLKLKELQEEKMKIEEQIKIIYAKYETKKSNGAS